MSRGDPAKSHSQEARKAASKADIPTLAAADKYQKLPEALMQADPAMLSQVLPNFIRQFMQIRNLLTSFDSMNKNSNGSNKNTTANNDITNVFSGALAILVNRFSYYQVLTVLFNALGDNKYKNITTGFQDIVLNAIIALVVKADKYGIGNIPYSTIPEVTYGSRVPTPLYASYNDIPDYYVQTYYAPELDPHPGYMEWVGTNGDKVYVKRTKTDYPYSSVDHEVHTTAEINFAEELKPYFIENNLTVEILNPLLIKYNSYLIDNKLNKNMGKNSANNMLSLLSMFAGLAAQLASKAQTNHLPPSVLDQGSMSKTLDEHKKNIGKLKKMKSLSETAFISNMTIPGLGSINGFGGLSSLMSMLSNSGSSNSNQQKAAQVASQVISTIKNVT